jgi:hypothetical protein
MSSDYKLSVETYEIKNKINFFFLKFDFTQGDTWRHVAPHGDKWRHTATRGATWRHSYNLMVSAVYC